MYLHPRFRPTEKREFTFPTQFIFIFFLGRASELFQGFVLKFIDGGSTPSPKQVTFLKEDSSFSMHYPPRPLPEYGNHQAFFITGSPPNGKRATVSVTDIYTETTHDWVTFMWLSPYPNGSIASHYIR